LIRWFVTGVWLLYLVQPIDGLFGHHHGTLWIAGGVTIAAAFCAVYVPVLTRLEGSPRLARGGLAALALLAALAVTVYGPSWTPLWIYVSAAAGMVLATGPAGRRIAIAGVAAVSLCYAFFGWLSISASARS
jgi:hypothetical protein